MAALQNTLADVKEAAEDSVLVRDLLHDAWDVFGDVVRSSHVLRIAAALAPMVGAAAHHFHLDKGEPVAVFSASFGLFGYHCWVRYRKARAQQAHSTEGGHV